MHHGLPQEGKTAEAARGGREQVLISLTTEPTPGYPICDAVLSFFFFFFFFFPTLVQASPVQRPVPFSVVMLEGGLNVWSQSEHWNHECFPRWLLIWAVLHKSRLSPEWKLLFCFFFSFL